MTRSRTALGRIRRRSTFAGLMLITGAWLGACSSHQAPTPKAAAAEKAAQAKLAGKTGDRPESDESGPDASLKSRLDAAATDLQNLFDQRKANPDGLKSSSAASSPTSSGEPNPSLALDDVQNEKPARLDPKRGKTASAATPPALPDDPDAMARLATVYHSAPPPSASPIPAATGFRLGTTAMCQRVEGFGRFTPLPNNKFIAGRPALMILYTEVLNFSQREEPVNDRGTDIQHVVELSQEVSVLLDSDGSKQVAVPEQTVRDAARTPRKDFFVVQRLELPRNLSVGKYNLKITVRDKASGAEAERILPIVIIADPSVVNSTPSGAVTSDGTLGFDSVRIVAPKKPGSN